MGLDARKPVIRVSDKASFKPDSLVTETSLKIEISLVASLDMVLSNKQLTKALISLRRCAGWSAPLLFANPRRQVFSRRGPDGKNSAGGKNISILHLSCRTSDYNFHSSCKHMFLSCKSLCRKEHKGLICYMTFLSNSFQSTHPIGRVLWEEILVLSRFHS